MQSNADMELELDRADPGGGEKKKRNDAKIPGECGWYREKEGEGEKGEKISLGSHQGPLMVMRDGVQGYGVINPCIIWFLEALGGISGEMKGWKEE